MLVLECVLFGLALFFTLRFAYGIAGLLSDGINTKQSNTIANVSCFLASGFWATYYIIARLA